MTTADILSAIRSIGAEKDAPNSIRYALNVLAAEVEAKVRAEEAAKQGKGSAVAVLNRVIKSGGSSRPNLGGAWMDGKGRQCVCDGLLAFRLHKSLPLPPLDEKYHQLNLDAVYDGPKSNAVKLAIPSRAALKSFIVLERATFGKKSVASWNFGDGLPAVDASLLLDVLTVFPDAELYAGNPFRPILVKSADGDGLLCPMRNKNRPAAAILETARHRSADGVPELTFAEFMAVAVAC